MTQEEFLALCRLIEFDFESLNNFELEDKEKDKSIRKDLHILKIFIERYGKLLE
jgi:hypothetical protein|tara:strand:- start:337 stop:498 length:162 start_codon:yes stop_codon:yes gene_type:complete